MRVLLLLGLLFPCTTWAQKNVRVDHTPWNTVVSIYVGADGLVDYKGIAADPIFQRYLQVLQRFAPEATWPEVERKAWWINASNAMVVQLVARQLPIDSVGAITLAEQKKVLVVQGTSFTVDELMDHVVGLFGDPRVICALHRASRDSPVLATAAYTADHLDEQLEAAARRFVNHPRRNVIGSEEGRISWLFSHYAAMFPGSDGLRSFLLKYSAIPPAANVRLRTMPRDPGLNAR
ncbi:MAG: DUF547 domain-containing protein [Flavobacteriales bacterium]|nr:DUF547 domain-containing protein [Flavobacteriales bacterium]